MNSHTSVDFNFGCSEGLDSTSICVQTGPTSLAAVGVPRFTSESESQVGQPS